MQVEPQVIAHALQLRVGHHLLEPPLRRRRSSRPAHPRPSAAARRGVRSSQPGMGQPVGAAPSLHGWPQGSVAAGPDGQFRQLAPARGRSAGRARRRRGARTRSPRSPASNGLAVARPARRQSAPKGAPDPQFTISGRRPEVSSNASGRGMGRRRGAPVRRGGGIHDHAWSARPTAAQSPSQGPSPAPASTPELASA